MEARTHSPFLNLGKKNTSCVNEELGNRNTSVCLMEKQFKTLSNTWILGPKFCVCCHSCCSDARDVLFFTSGGSTSPAQASSVVVSRLHESKPRTWSGTPSFPWLADGQFLLTYPGDAAAAVSKEVSHSGGLLFSRSSESRQSKRCNFRGFCPAAASSSVKL